ncbi:Gfo/Idh/MocA family oxidoreductase [Pigmentiphaga soli]|uniref:Gfo/Idh/MocA family oxidoreductase n=1 Tax=Pigmentiphaga soli TaxID=1007095 RepID=A0ABP8HAN3_9BURK
MESQGKAAPAGRVLKLGIAGVGVGAAEMLPSMEAMGHIEMTAAADINPRILEAFRTRYGGRTYDSVEKLCADPEVEAVWIATPNRFHAEHAIIAAEHGKHVVVEKPMAISMQEAERMIEASIRNGVKLICGHTQSFLPHVQTMRRIIRSGEVGKLCALNVWAYSDWMLRPRTAEELDIAQGGGVPFRQGPHQVDTLRLLGGGLVRSVRGAVGQWFAGRPIPGYYSAFMEFEDGLPATLVHNGYGYFVAAELVPWGSQNHHYSPEQRIAVRRGLSAGNADESNAKDQMRIGGAHERPPAVADGPQSWTPNDLGILIASCERGDLRQSRFGIYVHDDGGTRDVPLTGSADPKAGRIAELEELYAAVVLDRPVRHSGPWGMATLEVCLAIMQSSRERREIRLAHQVAAAD